MTNLIIDPNYSPSLDLNYVDYFSRAMNFGQTNYQQQLKTLNNTFFHKLVPTIFFEKYCSVICNISFCPYHYYFINDQVLKSLSVIQDVEQRQSMHQAAQIINSGTKLFGWEKYRDNFLDKSHKLQALPLIDAEKSLQLTQSLGLMEGFVIDPLLIKLALRWNFECVDQMCEALMKKFILSRQLICQILLYSLKTFEPA